MSAPITKDEAAIRRARILEAARWCFLNFGFAKTSLGDIAKRAGLSRTLLYGVFKDKEQIFGAVFEAWLISRRPAAQEVVEGHGSPDERLLKVCRLLVIEPWAEMVCTPMGGDFLDACGRIAPESEALYQEVMFECVGAILDDDKSTEVFLLAVDGLTSDRPSKDVLEQRIRLLIARFTPRPLEEGAPK